MTWRAPELEPELQRLAHAEAAARSALDHACVELERGRMPRDQFRRLHATWGEAVDRLADAIEARDRRAREWAR